MSKPQVHSIDEMDNTVVEMNYCVLMTIFKNCGVGLVGASKLYIMTNKDAINGPYGKAWK